MQGLGLSLEELAGQPLELFAREGARLILTVAVEEEVTEFLKRGPYERSRDFRGYRNGRRARRLNCGAGEIELASYAPYLRHKPAFSFPVAWRLAAPE
jgi:transposase-like protein